MPDVPIVFTKYPASLTGPFDDIAVVGDTTDWEVELVVVGPGADRVTAADAWSHVAGLTVGQDISDRHLQFAAGSQYSLGKSRRTYGPVGPWIVTPDELDDPDDLALGCSVDGEKVQDARTSDLIFDVSRLIAELSAVLPLLPGDLIFTGTPGGVGIARTPPRFLQPGSIHETWFEGVGVIRSQIVAATWPHHQAMVSPDELTDALLMSMREIDGAEGDDGPMVLSTTTLHYACNRTMWSTTMSWEGVRDCARALLDRGAIAVVDGEDSGHRSDPPRH